MSALLLKPHTEKNDIHRPDDQIHGAVREICQVGQLIQLGGLDNRTDGSKQCTSHEERESDFHSHFELEFPKSNDWHDA